MFYYFLIREIRDKYSGSSSVVFWILFQPLLILLIYYFVFGFIFKSRVPDYPESQFITYLASGLWPWFAFSESVLKSVTSLTDKKDLIGKVKVDLKTMVLASTSANFLLHFIGFIVVMAALILFGLVAWHLNLLLLLIPFALLFFLATILSLLLSFTNVFIKDLQQVMNSFMMMWFFLTPIIYSIGIIPESVQGYFKLNPVFFIFDLIHSMVFNVAFNHWYALGILTIGMVVLFYISVKLFNRVSVHIDDYV